jgi:hypothetical protein
MLTLVAIPINTASGIRALDASVVFVGMVVVRTCVFVCVCACIRVTLNAEQGHVQSRLNSA